LNVSILDDKKREPRARRRRRADDESETNSGSERYGKRSRRKA